MSFKGGIEMKIGLCCAGGGAAGSLQAGMLKAVSEIIRFNNISAISAASVGTLNAAMYAQGDLDKLLELWKTTKRKHIYKIFNFRGLFNFFGTKSYFDASPLYRLIDTNVDPEMLRNSHMEFHFISTNSDTGEAVYATEYTDHLIQRIKGSCAIPICFPEIEIVLNDKLVNVNPNLDPEKLFLWDGGIFDNTPLDPLVKAGCTHILLLHAHPKDPPVVRNRRYGRRKAIAKAIQVLFRANQQSDRKRIEDMNEAIREGRETNGKRIIEITDIYPTLDVGTLEFDHKKSEERINDGYREAMKLF
jgi:NTE family protein